MFNNREDLSYSQHRYPCNLTHTSCGLRFYYYQITICIWQKCYLSNFLPAGCIIITDNFTGIILMGIFRRTDPSQCFSTYSISMQELEYTVHFITCEILFTKGTYILDKLHPVDQLRTVLEWCKGTIGEAVDGFCHLFKVYQCHQWFNICSLKYMCLVLCACLILSTCVLYYDVCFTI